MTPTDAINDYLQAELKRRQLAEVPAVEAARWLDGAGLLADSAARPGLPLRNLLRDGVIVGSDQRPPRLWGRWFIVASPPRVRTSVSTRPFAPSRHLPET
jgi:hypothetical protein